jgi:hypothetical protein
MTNGLRQRNTTGMLREEEQQQEVRVPTAPSSSLAAPKMLRASPQHHGAVLKLHSALLFMILPRFVQSLIIKFLPFLRPCWQERHLILLGSYLYKFSDEKSSSPKGSPIPVESIEVHAVHSRDADNLVFPSLPSGYQVLSVTTLRKQQYFAVRSKEEAMSWLHSLHEARHEATKREMGHAPLESYPQSWSYYDRLGASMAKCKDRVRNRMQEMEMKNLSDDGPMARGYYG